VTAHHIADKSALERMRHPSVRSVLSPLILAGDLATCGVIELEVLYSARNFDDLVQTRRTRSLAFQLIETVQADFEHIMAITGQAMRWVVAGGSVP
jgi:predicted nucleic acid-binding protein